MAVRPVILTPMPPKPAAGLLAVLAATCCVVAGLAVASPTTMPATAPALPTFLSGIVTLADGVTPVAKADVSAKAMGDMPGDRMVSDLTDDNGCFVLSRPLAPGRYSVSVRENFGSTPLQEIEVGPQSGPIGLHLKLPAATVHGRVTDPSGAPVANTMVMLGNRERKLYYNVNTDANGDYAVAHVLPGVYDLTTTSARTQAPAEKSAEMLMSRVKGLTIGDSDLTQDLALKPRPKRTASTTQASTSTSQPTTAPATPRLTAVVTLADGVTPVVDSFVAAQPVDERQSSEGWTAMTDKSGAFKVTTAIRPGTYRVRVLNKKYTYLSVQNIDIAPGDATQDFRLRLPNGSVSGRVVDDAGRPVEGVSISLLGSANDSTYRTATTDAAGGYQIEHLLPGTYMTMATRNRSKSGGAMMTWESQKVDVGVDPVTRDFGTAPGAATAPATQP